MRPFFFNVYLFFFFERDKETEHEWGTGRERRRQRIRSRLCTDGREPDAGLKLTNREIMT